MKNIILINLFLFTTGSVFAQLSGQVQTYTPGVGAYTDALYNYAMGSISDKDEKSVSFDKNIKGSPYSSNDFQPTSVYYGDEPSGKLYYRYNGYNQEIEIKQQNLVGEPIRALGKDKKIKIMVNGRPMSFKTFIDKNGVTQNGYLTLINDGKFKLYKRLNITFKEAKKSTNSFTEDVPARFTQFTEYYLESEDGKRINQLELNNKKFLKLVETSKQDSVKKFIKENKIKFKDENDIQTVLNFLNS